MKKKHGTKLARGNLQRMSNIEKMSLQGSKVFQSHLATDCWERNLKAESIVIVAHKSPDGDAVGSALALHAHLRAMRLNSFVVLPDGFPAFLNWLPQANDIILFDEDPIRANTLIENADVLWCLDFNGPSRVGNMEEALRSSQGYKIVVDHHLEPESFADVLFSDPVCGSTCELIYGLIEAWGQLESLTLETAQCVYTGMMTDTGSFRFGSVTGNTHRILGHLLDAGVAQAWIHDQVFGSNRIAKIKLQGFAMSKKLVVWPEHKTALISLTQYEMKEFDCQAGDTEGLVNQALALEGIDVAVFMKESEEGHVKMSFRSKGEFSVRDLVAAHFNGGGHRNAAGGILLNTSVAEAISFFESLLDKWMPV
jgi:phosphoesterase RecJ-like protein